MYVGMGFGGKRVDVGNGTAVKLIDRVEIRGRLLSENDGSYLSLVPRSSSAIYPPVQKPQNPPRLSAL